MKFLVDELPFYGDECPFAHFETDMYPCPDKDSDTCPRHWDKYKVCDPDTPRECCWLKEYKEREELHGDSC